MNPKDRVKLLSIPTGVIETKEKFPDTYQIFSVAVGNQFTVQDINEFGMAELYIKQNGGNSDSPCDDSVWVEREFLEILKPQNQPEQDNPITRP